MGALIAPSAILLPSKSCIKNTVEKSLTTLPGFDCRDAGNAKTKHFRRGGLVWCFLGGLKSLNVSFVKCTPVEWSWNRKYFPPSVGDFNLMNAYACAGSINYSLQAQRRSAKLSWKFINAPVRDVWLRLLWIYYFISDTSTYVIVESAEITIECL